MKKQGVVKRRETVRAKFEQGEFMSLSRCGESPNVINHPRLPADVAIYTLPGRVQTHRIQFCKPFSPTPPVKLCGGQLAPWMGAHPPVASCTQRGAALATALQNPSSKPAPPPPPPPPPAYPSAAEIRLGFCFLGPEPFLDPRLPPSPRREVGEEAEEEEEEAPGTCREAASDPGGSWAEAASPSGEKTSFPNSTCSLADEEREEEER